MFVLWFLIILSLLVFVHEFGHFWVARRCGITVEEFGFGFPPRIAGIRRGGTLYSINWIPIGGFVRLKGEDADDDGAADSFASKSAGVRAAVLVAGVAMNVLLAVVLFAALYTAGVPTSLDEGVSRWAEVSDRRVMIQAVPAGSSAAAAGVHVGDELAALDERVYVDASTARTYLQERTDTPVQATIKRGETYLHMELKATAVPGQDRPIFGLGLATVGTVRYPWYAAPVAGVQATWQLAGNMLRAMGDAVGGGLRNGTVPADLMGPVGIAVVTDQVIQLGWIPLLHFVAMLSLSLAVVNILPIPALDGGRLLFVVLEVLRGGRRTDRSIERWAHTIGFVLLMALVLAVTYQDVLKLF